jgi:short-subunit dehydrogenase
MVASTWAYNAIASWQKADARMNLHRKVALVTGGSSGVGLALARALVQRGARVVLIARNRDSLQKAVTELGAENAAAVSVDVADRVALCSLPQTIVETYGQLDLLINNAGVNHRGALAERTSAEILQILEVNLLAPVLLTHAALPYLGRGAAVINVASLAGKIPVPHEASYSASKAGLRAFSRALDAELSQRGVRVLSVCPGPVDTGFLADLDHVPNLVFSQPMSSPEQVAEGALRALDGGLQEVDVPGLSGRLATLGYLFPAFMKAIRPALERRGARNKRRYAAQRARG